MNGQSSVGVTNESSWWRGGEGRAAEGVTRNKEAGVRRGGVEGLCILNLCGHTSNKV